MYVVDSNPVSSQTRAIQAHLRQDGQCLLGLPDLAAISVAAKCDPKDWKSLLANRKFQSDALLESVEKLTRTSTDVTRNPLEAGHILMCCPLTSTATQSQAFVDFCKELNAEPSTATQTLYFLLPFAESHQSAFLGSRYFEQWFPDHSNNAGYKQFAAQLPIVETSSYKEGLGSIFRKLDFASLEGLVPESIAERYGLRAPKPVAVKDYMALQLDLRQIMTEVKNQERRTEIGKIDKYDHKLAKLNTCLVKGTSMKPKHLQKKVNKASSLLAMMKLNCIDEKLLRDEFTERYAKALPIYEAKRQKVVHSRIKVSGNYDAYTYIPLKIAEHTPLDDLEKACEEIERHIKVLSDYTVTKSN